MNKDKNRYHIEKMSIYLWLFLFLVLLLVVRLVLLKADQLFERTAAILVISWLHFMLISSIAKGKKALHIAISMKNEKSTANLIAIILTFIAHYLGLIPFLWPAIKISS